MKEEVKIVEDLVKIIEESRDKAFQKVHEEVINMYWEVGKYLSSKTQLESYGSAVVNLIAEEIKNRCSGIKGFNRRGLYRMKQFYETYKDEKDIKKLLKQVGWTNHLIIITKSKSREERLFYLKLCAKEFYTTRELTRQIDSMYYERFLASNSDNKLNEQRDNKQYQFLKSYIFEFVDLADGYKEVDVRKALVENMKDFILEIGKDFSFIGEEFKVRVGGEDFRIDLLFFHRGLKCLVAFELKIGEFKPEYISKMDFYLEALDRQIKKENENPSVGMILCASKNDEVVEYAMSRTMSPLSVAEYKTKLPDKEVLQNKMKEILSIQMEDRKEDVKSLFGIAPGDETVKGIKDERLDDK